MRYLVAILALCGTAWADEDEHPEVRKFAEKLDPEGLSGKILAISRSEAGRRALGEALDGAVEWKIRLFGFEDYFFTRDAEGQLTLRPERKQDMDKVTPAVAEAKALFEAFTKRAEELAARIGEATDLDRRLKAAWKSPEYRMAEFHHFVQDGDEDKDAAGRLETFFQELIEEKFEAKGDALAAKSGAFTNEEGMIDLEDLEHNLKGGEFAEERARWVDVSERCTDAALAELFASPFAVAALEHLKERARETWTAEARKTSWDSFARRYFLAATGEKCQWRPDRAAKVDEILRRAKEIEKEIAEEEGGSVGPQAETAHPLDAKAIVLDETVVSKAEKQPDLVGRVTVAIRDNGVTLVTLRIPGDAAHDVTVYVRTGAMLRFVGIDPPLLAVGQVACVWLRPGSKEDVETVRFALEK